MDGKKKGLSRVNMGGLTAILVVMLALLVSPFDVCSEGFILTPTDFIDDIVYLVGVIKVIMEMVNKQKAAKQARQEQRGAQHDAASESYNDVESN